MFITNLKRPITYSDESKNQNFTNNIECDESDAFDKYENFKKSREVLKEIKVSRDFILLL